MTETEILVLIPFSSGLRFGPSSVPRHWPPIWVLIPFSSGLRFGRSGIASACRTRRLNPLQFGSSIRSVSIKQVRRERNRLNPLQFGSSIRSTIERNVNGIVES